MGKMALLVVMSLSLVVGIITYTINKSKNTLVEKVSGFQKYTSARNIAHTGVNMMLSKMDANDTSVINYLKPNMQAVKIFSISSGICTMTVKLASLDTTKRDTVDITARSRFMDTTRYMKIRLYRTPVPFPSVNEALGLRVPDVKFTIKGTGNNKGFIDGRNHDEYGNLTTQPDTANKPGVGVLAPKDTTDVLIYADNINGTKDVVVDSALFDPRVYADEYINAADRVYPDGSVIANATWGTRTAPEIVLCQGDVHISGTVTGWGILVVQGDLRVSGRIDFHGLVVVYKESVIDVVDVLETGGGSGANIIGGMMMAGPAGSSFEMRGSQQTLYSKAALDLAKFINKLQAYRVLYWYE